MMAFAIGQQQQQRSRNFQDYIADLNSRYGNNAYTQPSSSTPQQGSPATTSGGQTPGFATPTGGLGVNPQTARGDFLDQSEKARRTRADEFRTKAGFTDRELTMQERAGYQGAELAKTKERNRANEAKKDRNFNAQQASANRTMAMNQGKADRDVQYKKMGYDYDIGMGQVDVSRQRAGNEGRQIDGENKYKMFAAQTDRERADNERYGMDKQFDLGIDTNRTNLKVAQFTGDINRENSKRNAAWGLVGNIFQGVWS